MRIVSWNLHGSAQPNLEVAALYLAGFNPDILLIQEIQRKQCELLASELNMNWSWRFKHWPILKRPEGLAILSRDVLVDAERIVLTPAPFYSYRRRIAMRAQVGGRNVVNCHFSSGNPEVQPAEVVRTLEYGQQAVVIGGDFNATPQRPTPTTFVSRGFVDATEEAVGSLWRDANSVVPNSRIDYVFTRGARSCTLIHAASDDSGWSLLKTLSDHAPVIADVDF